MSVALTPSQTESCPQCQHWEARALVAEKRVAELSQEQDQWKARAQPAEARIRWEDDLFASDQIQASDKIVARTLYLLACQARGAEQKQPILNMELCKKAGISRETLRPTLGPGPLVTRHGKLLLAVHANLEAADAFGLATVYRALGHRAQDIRWVLWRE